MTEQAGPPRLRPQVPSAQDPTGLLRMLAADDNIVGMRMTDDGIEIELYDADGLVRPSDFHGLAIKYLVQDDLSLRDPQQAGKLLADLLADDANVLGVTLEAGMLQVDLAVADDALRPLKMHGLPVRYRVASL